MHHWNSPFFDPSLHHTTLAIQILLLVCKNCGFIIHGLYDRMPLEDSKSHLQFAFLPPSAQPIIQQTTLLGSNERKTEVPYLLPSYFCKKKDCCMSQGGKRGFSTQQKKCTSRNRGSYYKQITLMIYQCLMRQYFIQRMGQFI